MFDTDAEGIQLYYDVTEYYSRRCSIINERFRNVRNINGDHIIRRKYTWNEIRNWICFYFRLLIYFVIGENYRTSFVSFPIKVRVVPCN